MQKPPTVTNNIGTPALMTTHLPIPQLNVYSEREYLQHIGTVDTAYSTLMSPPKRGTTL